MRYLAKRALSLLLALLLCLTLFPAAALAEEGSISSVEDEGDGLSGTPAPTEKDEPGTIVGDGIPGVPSDDPAALAQEPTADEIQGIVASGSCGENLTWNLDDAGLLTISGEGAMTDWNPQEAPWYSQRGSIQTVQIEENITNIGSAAFYGCSRLTSVTIPESVTSIGVGAFFNCNSLTSVMIPSSVTSIEDSAFQDCSSLKIVLFQGNPPYFFSKAFYNDLITALYPIDNPAWTADKLKNYGDGTMTWVGYRDEAASYTIHFDPNGGSNAPEDQIKGHNVDITLTSAVPSHEKGTFLGWSTRLGAAEPEYQPGDSFGLNGDTTLYAVWEGVPSIVDAGNCGENLTWTLDDAGLLTISGEGKMTDWSKSSSVPWYGQQENIISILIENGVTTIGVHAFCNCSSVTSVTIPASVTCIGASAFEGCNSLASVMIPESITGIGSSAFAFCCSLQEIRVAEGNKAYTSVDGVLYDASLRNLLRCPGGKTGEVLIPESVTSIEFSALQGCSCLMGVTIPASVTSIGRSAFASCSSLSSMTIPVGVITIGSGAFALCSSLRIVLFQGDAPMIEGGVFANDRTTALYPMDNPTWTSDKIQDYGAEKLTWVGYRDEAKAYTIHFDANGGSDAPEDQIKGHNVDITLTSAEPSREDATFLGWSTRRGAALPDYLPGDRFGLNADTILYAVWKLEAPVLPTEAVLSLGSAKVCAGQEFTVELTMEKNPGLMYLSFRLDYDADALAFLGAEDGAFSGWMVNTEKSFLTWDSDEDRTENGTLLRLRFHVKEDAATGETAIALADLFATNYAEELLGIGSIPGTVTVLPHTPGDVTGDGEVDGRDLVRLRKYLAGTPGFEIVEANTNVNGDDGIDILDLVRLRKYLAQYDVILE